jgi:hypothetical protein
MNAPLPRAVTDGIADPATVYDAQSPRSNEVAGRLAARLACETRGEVLFSPADRGRYATDASIYQEMPVGVFVPRNADDVKMALDICRDLGVPIVPRGGGTSQCGQTVGAGLVIDHSSNMCATRGIDADQRTVEVEPGIVLDHLNAELRSTGLWYPVDVSTSAQATLGGMAGNNSCGSRSIAYGNMVHNVLGARGLDSDGQLHHFEKMENCTGRARRWAAGAGPGARPARPRSMSTGPRCCAAWVATTWMSSATRTSALHPGRLGQSGPPAGGQRRHAGADHSLTLQLAELPRAKVLGVVNFPTFYKAMDTAQHIVRLGERHADGAMLSWWTAP